MKLALTTDNEEAQLPFCNNSLGNTQPEVPFLSTTQVISHQSSSDFWAPSFQDSLWSHNNDLGLEANALYHWDTGASTSPAWLFAELLPAAQVAKKLCKSTAKSGLAVIPSAPQPCVLEERQLEKKLPCVQLSSYSSYNVTVTFPNVLGLIEFPYW